MRNFGKRNEYFSAIFNGNEIYSIRATGEKFPRAFFFPRNFFYSAKNVANLTYIYKLSFLVNFVFFGMCKAIANSH